MIAVRSTFTLTDNHLKLLANAKIRWSNHEDGAPYIDPKRPYSHGPYYHGIAEVLGWSKPDLEACKTIHRETQWALEIVLHNLGSAIVLGTYVMQDDGKWKLADGR